MKLEELGEFAFIDRIARGAPKELGAHVLRGIGDDAAVVETPRGVQLLTTDMLIEGVHFLRDVITPRQLGAKAITVNLSDIAAMGGTPRDALVSIAVPPDTDVAELDALYEGMGEVARRHEVSLLGGDTTASPRDLCLNVVVLGHAAPEEVLYRSGARIGDRVLVTGTLGDARAGLEILLGRLDLPSTQAATLVRAHLEPTPYLAEARIAATSGIAHAAIDLSDGLSSDLGHVCRASSVAAVVNADDLPISAAVRAAAERLDVDPVSLAVGGGEDYRLLVTAAPDGVEAFRRRIRETSGCPLYDVGEIVAGQGVRLHRSDGPDEELHATGWDHFRAP